ncbi:hypothetical protein [Flavisphingomonas formosensis]|uniref:hypothetical protein n=1 Tax=Flavisphingomonas formosensis TaxID=861534 RepID=UPI0012FB1065|nr:hypothetical protein [Sphingomonas formosensis]
MGIVGSIVGGVASGKASKKAAKIEAETQAANRAFAEKIYDKGVALIQPEVDSGNAAGGYIDALLGLDKTDSAAADKAFQNYRDTSGYQFLQDEAQKGVLANSAAAGAFQSGATAKALQERAMNLADQTKNNYITQLTDVANRGTSAKGSVISQGQNLTNTVVNANNAQGTAAANNALNQGAIINNVIGGISSSIGSSFGGGGGILSALFG